MEFNIPKQNKFFGKKINKNYGRNNMITPHLSLPNFIQENHNLEFMKMILPNHEQKNAKKL